MIDRILNETDVDVIQALTNKNPNARQEFLNDSSMKRPSCIYPELDKKKYQNSLKQINNLRTSNEYTSLSTYDKQITDITLDYNQLKNEFLLSICEWNEAKNPYDKNRAEEKQHHLNAELYGVPEKLIFDSILCSLIKRIEDKELTDNECFQFDELLKLLPEIPKNAPQQYRPSEKILNQFSEMANDFYHPLLKHIPNNKDKYTIQEAVDIVNEILNTELQEFGDIWCAVYDIGRISAAVNQDNRRILFPASRIPDFYTYEELKKIIVHELGVHVLRAMPYQNMRNQSFSHGFPGYETIEEGIAKLMEQGITGEYQESGIIHYITIGLSYFYNLDFRKIFEIQKRLQGLSQGISEIICYNSVHRMFRGTDQLPIYKDLVYYNGANSIWKYVEENIDDPTLFDSLLLSAKTDIFNQKQMVLVNEAKNGRFS